MNTLGNFAVGKDYDALGYLFLLFLFENVFFGFSFFVAVAVVIFCVSFYFVFV